MDLWQITECGFADLKNLGEKDIMKFIGDKIAIGEIPVEQLAEKYGTLARAKADREGWDEERLAAFLAQPVFSLRPEVLSVEDFIDLTNQLA